MPHVLSRVEMERMELYKNIENMVDVNAAFRNRQCDTTTVLAQASNFSWRLSVKTSPENVDMRLWLSKLERAKINWLMLHSLISNFKNAYAMLNQDRYPVVDYDLSFPNGRDARVYKDAVSFSQHFYGIDELVTHSGINPRDLKDLFLILVFDVRRQNEKLKASVIDIQIKCLFSTAVPAYTQAYALVISDRLVVFKSDGNKMSVVY